MYDVGNVEQLNSGDRWIQNNPVNSLSVPIGVRTDGELFTLELGKCNDKLGVNATIFKDGSKYIGCQYSDGECKNDESCFDATDILLKEGFCVTVNK
jgi:hypothetical protein